MAREEGIDIVLRLRDEAGQVLKGALADATKEVDKFNKTAKEAGKSVSNGFKEASKNVKTFRRDMFIVTAIIAAVIAVTKEWSKHNQETKKAFDSLGLAIKEVTSLIGSLLAPAIITIAEIMKMSLGFIRNAFKEIQDWFAALIEGFTYGIVFWKSFVSEIMKGTGVMNAYSKATEEASKAGEDMRGKITGIFKENILQTDLARIKLEEYKKLQQDLELLFKSGQITAQEYFNGIIQGQNQVIQQNEIIAEQSRAYIDLANEVANIELLNFQTRLQGQMDMFGTYKEMYMQGHADMFAFANMLANQFHANMSNALSSIILGEAKARDAFKAFGQAMLKAIVDYMVQQAIAFAVSKIMQGVITATTSAMAATLAAAWAPAAAMASLATLGGNAAPAIEGMALTTAAAYVLAAPKGMAQGGEGIVTRPTLFLAGEAGSERYSFAPIGRGGAGRDINIYLTAVINNRSDILSLAEELGIAVERELRYARGI